MNKFLTDVIDATSPKFNTNVVNGTAKGILKDIPEFLNDIIMSHMKSLSPKVDLKYVGYRRMTPLEEFRKMFVNENNKSTFDLANSDLYMVEYIFEYNGRQISRPLYLPFCDRGNLIKISNTNYVITPVLSDTVISPSHKEVFVRLLKDKLTFRSSSRNFVVNGERIPGQIVHTKIVKVNNNQLTDKIGKPLTAVSLYLLGEYGFRETMNRYCGTEQWIVTEDNVDNYREEYNVFESTKQKPRSLKEHGYQGHNVKICIHNNVKMTPFLENFIYGLIYTLDILPDNADDAVSVINGVDVENEKLFWRILLGRVTYKNSYSVDRLVEDINDHFDTLQGYLDTLIQNKLKENGIMVNNFFDLLVEILDRYNVWLLNSKEYNSDISNRYIDIHYYILYDIIVGFNRVILNINRRIMKKEISEKEINKIFANELSPRKIFSLVKSQAMNLSIMLADYSGDIIYPKTTAPLEDQSRGNGVKRGTKSQFPDATKTLKGHDLALGSLLFLTKTAPSPRFRSNLYLDYDLQTGRLIIDDELTKTIEVLDDHLRGRVENKAIETFEITDDNLD
jgi:hypothetical protein